MDISLIVKLASMKTAKHVAETQWEGRACQNFDVALYSTRTQNTWRRGLALGNAPDARILRYPTQNIPTCWYILR